MSFTALLFHYRTLFQGSQDDDGQHTKVHGGTQTLISNDYCTKTNKTTLKIHDIKKTEFAVKNVTKKVCENCERAWDNRGPNWEGTSMTFQNYLRACLFNAIRINDLQRNSDSLHDNIRHFSIQVVQSYLGSKPV